MKRFLLFAGIGVVVIAIAMAVTFYFMKRHTKSFSPEEETEFNYSALTIRVFYNRPSKKGREIFGKLVPYNVVWRTGANAATSRTRNSGSSNSSSADVNNGTQSAVNAASSKTRNNQ